MPNISLFHDAELEREVVDLSFGEVYLPLTSNVGEGEKRQYFGVNSDTSTLRRVVLDLVGEGRESLRLAPDNEGFPGVWAAPGEGILIAEFLNPRDSFSFWTQPIFTHEDREGERNFQLMFRATALG